VEGDIEQYAETKGGVSFLALNVPGKPAVYSLCVTGDVGDDQTGDIGDTLTERFPSAGVTRPSS
jgi:hypothetical protein